MIKVLFIDHGFYGENLLGKSFLNYIVIQLIDIPLCCFSEFYISYTSDYSEYHGEIMLIMNRISMSSNNSYIQYLKFSAGNSVQSCS